MMKRVFVWLFIFFFSISYLISQTTYSEDFDVADNWAGGNMTAYNAKTYTNSSTPANDQFSSNNALRETSDVHSGSYAWRIKNASGAYFRYECEETVNSFQVYMARWDNNPSPNVEIRYSTNSGATYTTIENIFCQVITDDNCIDVTNS